MADYSKEDLYKFALLEYKLGIGLSEAKRLVTRYGIDTEELPENDTTRYLKTLKEIIECENIEEKVQSAIQENTLGKPWEGTPSARNQEGEILNLYAELYNETLYQPKESDKDEQGEIYVDEKGDSHQIDVYNIEDDFNVNIRVEGAYRNFVEPEDFMKYYEEPDIKNHGNCESYIGNDSIAGARNTIGVAVGYKFIRENSLTACGPYDLNSVNESFSIYNEKSEFRTPKEMIDNTRHTHNEMVKDRLVIDENGNVSKYKPDYAIWIEEDTKEERSQEGWQEKRNQDSQWIMTKKLAAQLGIPIVVIDREHFAEREMEKVECLQKLINGEEIDTEKYGKYLEEYSQMSKSELIKEAITKFENNRTGIHFNKKIYERFFTHEQRQNLLQEISASIEQMPKEEAIECLKVLSDSCLKESQQFEMTRDEKINIGQYYNEIYRQTQEKLLGMQEKSQNQDRSELFELMDKISATDYYEGNKQHSIEHIQKVMLFSELLAEGEQLSDEDRRLLLVSAALHDSGRKGQDGNQDHAEPSAKLAGEILSASDEFGKFSPSDIATIQTAIHYHEYGHQKGETEEKGKVNIAQIKALAMKYAKENGLESIDIDRTIAISTLLKDADALDRYRFAERGKLNPKFLRSKTARKPSTIAYAQIINNKVAGQILDEVYQVEEVEDGFKDNVAKLRAYRQMMGTKEPHLDFRHIYEEPFPELELGEEQEDIDVNQEEIIEDDKHDEVEDKKKQPEEPIKDMEREMLQLYFDQEISPEQVKEVQEQLKNDFEQQMQQAEQDKNNNHKVEDESQEI
ncbi:MAG: HD domain-containing protein [Clostridia bacterium]|nr:HD domain-containing protein [Clostridia bacterium]